MFDVKREHFSNKNWIIYYIKRKTSCISRLMNSVRIIRQLIKKTMMWFYKSLFQITFTMHNIKEYTLQNFLKYIESTVISTL